MSPKAEVLGTLPSGNGPMRSAAASRPRLGVFGRILRLVTTAAVITGLAALAYYGHHTGWTFKPGGHGDKAHEPSASAGVAAVRFGPEHPAAAGHPPALRRAAAIEFDSAEAVAAAGIDITPAWRGALTEAVTANGELGFDPARVARVSARAPGSAFRVLKAMGDPVKAGEVMALVDAAEVGKAKAEFRQAMVQVRLKRQSFENLKTAGADATSAQRLREAESALRDAEVRLLGAEQALTNLGLPVEAKDYQSLSPDEAGKRLRLLGVAGVVGEGTRATANLLPVRSPFDGVVLSADVVAGEVVEAGKALFVVVDPSRLWLTLHVAPVDVARVSVGQTVVFRPDGLPEEFTGQLTWVGTAADETTRAVPVRAELANDSGQLRASTFGKGRVVLREVKDALVVPHAAVQSVSGTPVVFVRDREFLKPGGPKVFHVRPVRVGGKDAQNTEVLSGLEPGEVVATKGSSLLLDELKRALAARPDGE